MVGRIAASLLVVVLAACGGGDAEQASETPTPAAAAASGNAAAVFRQPKNGAKVSSPVRVKMKAPAVKIAEAGPVQEGVGHFHITVDKPCVKNGTVVPDNGKHLHYGDGSKSTKLKLKPGKHTLCLQVGNGAHEAFGKSDKVKITVKK